MRIAYFGYWVVVGLFGASYVQWSQDCGHKLEPLTAAVIIVTSPITIPIVFLGYWTGLIERPKDKC